MRWCGHVLRRDSGCSMLRGREDIVKKAKEKGEMKTDDLLWRPLQGEGRQAQIKGSEV